MKKILLLFIAFLFLHITIIAQEGWVQQTSGTTENLLGVSFTDANTGTAVGWNGTILRTIDGGDNWVSQSSGTLRWLIRVSFTTVKPLRLITIK